MLAKILQTLGLFKNKQVQSDSFLIQCRQNTFDNIYPADESVKSTDGYKTLKDISEEKYICPTTIMAINNMIDRSYEGYFGQHTCKEKLNSLKFNKTIRIPSIECSLIFSNNYTGNASAVATKAIKEKFNLDKRKMSEVALEIFSNQKNLVEATIDISSELLSSTNFFYNALSNDDNSVTLICPAPFDGKLPATTDTPCIPIDALLTLGF